MNDTVVSLKTIADMQNNNINFMLMHIKGGGILGQRVKLKTY